MKNVTPFAVNWDTLKSKPSDSQDPKQLALWPTLKDTITPVQIVNENSSPPVSGPFGWGALPMSKEYNNDAEAVKAGAVKYDAGKPTLLKGGLTYFPRAIALISAVSHFGASKYAWNGWRDVPNGFDRYSEAMLRHLVEEGSADPLDPDSRLPHIGHTAWNALARTELYLLSSQG